MMGMRAAGSDGMGDPARIGNSVRMEGTAPADAELRPEDFRFVERPDEASFLLRPSVSYWQDAWHRLRRNRAALLSAALLALVTALCVVGPELTPYGHEALSMTEKNLGPSAAHWFGTDKMGRDLFTRVAVGGRVSLIIALAGALIDILAGLLYGGVAAGLGGAVDNAMMRLADVLSSIPYLVLAVLVSLILGRGMASLLVAMTLTGWCNMAYLVRGQILQIKEQEFVLAARALGTSPWRILWKHLIPNIMGVMIVAVTFDIPLFIFGEAFLSYIGLGIQPPMTSWGALASGAQQQMLFYPWQLFFPTLFISLTMLSFQMLGDGLRDALDPRVRD